MIITDTFNGHTIEDVRRSADGSVTMYCDSGRALTFSVIDGEIQAKPVFIALDSIKANYAGQRLRLLEAFQGHMVDYVTRDDKGLTFVCEPLKHDREAYQKAHGFREIRLTHTDGIIDELPPVSAKVSLEGLKVFGAFQQ